MTSKDKAVEIYNRFFIEVPFLKSDDDLRDDMNASKRCAIIAVNEIISELKNLGLRYSIEWWEKVKQEIEKL